MFRVNCSALVVAALVSPGRADEAAADREKLQGTWKLVTVERDGGTAKVDSNAKLVIDGDKFEYLADGQHVKGTFAVDAKPAVRHMDLNPRFGLPGYRFKAIYKLDGEAIHYAFIGRGLTRPTDFPTRKGDDQTYQVWKKAK